MRSDRQNESGPRGEQGPRRASSGEDPGELDRDALLGKVRELEAALSEREEFIDAMSHELRTPLTPMVTALHLLRDDRRLPGELRPYVEILRRNLTAQTRLIDDLLDFVRLGRGRLNLSLAEISPDVLVARVVAELAAEASPAAAPVAFSGRSPDAMIAADAIRLEQALVKLMQAAGVAVADGNPLSAASSAATGQWVLELAHESLDDAAWQRLLDEVSAGQGTRRTSALGLSLQVAARLIELHGGRLEAAGGALCLRLPLAGPQRKVVTPARAAVPVKEVRILLVDDHEDTLSLMRMMLERRGYVVATAGSVAEAVEQAQAHPPDLLISDIGLPDGSGVDLLQRLRAGRPILGIALSGFGRDSDVQRSKEAGFLAHLTKPVNVQRLHEIIQSLFA